MAGGRRGRDTHAQRRNLSMGPALEAMSSRAWLYIADVHRKLGSTPRPPTN